MIVQREYIQTSGGDYMISMSLPHETHHPFPKYVTKKQQMQQ